MIETTIAIAIVTGLAEAFKRATGFPSKLTGLISILFAIAIGFLTVGSNITWQEVVFTGIVVGLSASGLYSNTKSVKEYVEN